MEYMQTEKNEKKRMSKFVDYEAARAYVSALGIKTQDEWRAYCRSGQRPPYIPCDPRATYRDSGWVSYGEWFGTKRIANQFRKFKPYSEAKAFAQSLGLKSWRAWVIYSKSGKKPKDIPACPEITYRDEGWENFGEWLGTGNKACHSIVFRSFEEARGFVHTLNLRNQKQWIAYCSSGRKPADIPSNPFTTYKGKGWKGYRDWLNNALRRAQGKNSE